MVIDLFCPLFVTPGKQLNNNEKNLCMKNMPVRGRITGIRLYSRSIVAAKVE